MQDRWHKEKTTGGSQRQAQDTKHMGMAAELADILSQLDDAAKLADELELMWAAGDKAEAVMQFVKKKRLACSLMAV